MDTKLYFTKEDIEKLKSTDDTRLKTMAESVAKQAETALDTKVLSESEVSCEDGRSGNIHESYYDASLPFRKNMLLLGFGYFYTGDEAYFEKAKALMLMYAGYKKWHGKGYHGRSELNTAHFCVGMAHGYSLFKEKLTADERKIIADGTYKLGILPTMEDWVLPGTKIHALDTMGHNWWIVCVSAAGLAASVMTEENPRNEELAKIAASSSKEWFDYPGNPINAKPVNIDNGGYYESVTYFNMSMKEYLLFRRGYRMHFGKTPFDDSKILSGAVGYFAKTLYPSDKEDYFVPFGDTSGKGVMDSMLYIAGEGIDMPELRWYLQAAKHREADLMDVINYSEIYEKDAAAPKELSALYEEIGWAVFHDSYKENSAMLAVKCGDTWNHAHADAGSFVFYKNGAPVIYDSGTCDYGHKNYVSYYCASPAHNVILFNGMGQDPRDFMNHARMRGRLYNFADSEGFRYVAADATGPMSRFFRKHIRHILWLDRFIFIYDDIECYEKGELSFLLHDEADSGFKMLTPHRTESMDGYKDAAPDDAVKIKVFKQMTDDDCRAKFVSVILPGDKAEAEFSEVENGFKTTVGGVNVYVNALSNGSIMHRNCTNTLGGYLTDAVILTEDNGRIGVVNASIVRKDSKVILDTLKRVNGFVSDNI